MANFGGVYFLPFLKKNTLKCLKSTLENGQKSGFYKVKFPKLQREDLPSIFGQISPLRPFHEYPPVQQVYHIYFCKKMVKNGIFLCPHSTHSALYWNTWSKFYSIHSMLFNPIKPLKTPKYGPYIFYEIIHCTWLKNLFTSLHCIHILLQSWNTLCIFWLVLVFPFLWEAIKILFSFSLKY